MADPVSPVMAVVMALSAGVLVAKLLYLLAPILQKEDPRFEGDKVIYRS